MNNKSRIHLWLASAGILLLLATLSGSGISPAYAHCKGKHTGNHPHCTPDPGGETDRIAGCVNFAAGLTIEGDGLHSGTDEYCDGDPTEDSNGNSDSMQVAMNCKFNHFNLYPGGGIGGDGRHIRVNIGSDIETGIESCKGVALPISINGTETIGGVDCGTSGTGWGFGQLLRTNPGATNVCDLHPTKGTASIGLTARLQTHLQHRKTCKGGSKKCGENFEVIDIFYNNSAGTDVTVTCGGVDATTDQCNEWSIATSNGELIHESGNEPVSIGGFNATFTTQ